LGTKDNGHICGYPAIRGAPDKVPATLASHGSKGMSDALINVVLPVFGIVLTGYLAGRFEALGTESAAALNRFVYLFALPPALFLFTARAPIEKVFNWPFIGAFVGGSIATLLISLLVGRIWFRHDPVTLSVQGLTAIFANVVYMGLPLLMTAYGPEGAFGNRRRTHHQCDVHWWRNYGPGRHTCHRILTAPGDLVFL
jgi:hypothetical protein